jgi:hypothetical protein
MRKLARDAGLLVGVAPRSILLSGEQPGFVSTMDGRPIPGSPNAERVFAHHRGFAIASSEIVERTWFTATGRSWKEVSSEHFQNAVEDGDAVLAFTETGALRVESDGTARPVTLTPDERLSKSLGRTAEFVPENWGPKDGYEGALIDAGWMLTGRSDDEWLGVFDGQMLIARVGSHEMHSLGKVGREDEMCGVAMIGGQIFLECAALGKRLSVFRVDLATERTILDRTVEVNRGFALNLGLSEAYPRTFWVAATCDGDADRGICVRDKNGVWLTLPPPPKGAQLFVSSSDALVSIRSPRGELELQVNGKTRRVFAAAEIRRVEEAMGVASASKEHPPSVVQTGFLRTTTGLRIFFTPNSWKPTEGDGDSYALDLPLDQHVAPSLIHVAGVVAAAGAYGLRLSKGQLSETSDGWQTWHAVEPPPPTGTPRDLGGTQCFEHGCILGIWARIGWRK